MVKRGPCNDIDGITYFEMSEIIWGVFFEKIEKTPLTKQLEPAGRKNARMKMNKGWKKACKSMASAEGGRRF